MTDEELIEGIKCRDRVALEHLVATHQQKVIKTAYYFLGNMEDAEDLSQEVFIGIVDSIAMFRKKSSLTTWIYRITVNQSLNFLKKRQRRAVFSRIGALFNPTRTGYQNSYREPFINEDPVEASELRGILKHAVGQLPENQQIAFILSQYDDRPYKEIAEIMELTLSSVESLIHRAKMNLQKRLISGFSEYKKH